MGAEEDNLASGRARGLDMLHSHDFDPLSWAHAHRLDMRELGRVATEILPHAPDQPLARGSVQFGKSPRQVAPRQAGYGQSTADGAAEKSADRRRDTHRQCAEE